MGGGGGGGAGGGMGRRGRHDPTLAKAKRGVCGGGWVGEQGLA